MWATSVPILVFLGLSVLELGSMYMAGLKLRGALGRYPIPAGAIYTRGWENWRFSTEIAVYP